ncbi:MAG: hypothetical protein Q7V58_00600 [Actinomycetota bacterium]|nr:hypothetical protein [Actinomycetota bacterium]
MSSPRSVRFEDTTLERLTAYAARHPGLSGASAAALLVEEGLRMDEHPAVVFRDGPGGRRAVVIGGPDVWEIIRALKDARQAEPELSRGELIALVQVNSGVAEPLIRAALDYYGAYPDEVDGALIDADRIEEGLRLAMGRARDFLGS